MSQPSEFVPKVQHDAQLKDRLKEATSEEMLVERVLAETHALGYDLDASEIRQRLAAYSGDFELTDADLDAVSGGGYTATQFKCGGGYTEPGTCL